ncbi:hypothetical protein CEP49_00140 [Mergibacter septicus]|uniref:hypothetical protein n=1 Tax=Mergibacter septicus TaxID=221402 RepID=UPI0011791A79|nr:hypothetical protein [Mergibacter septicus]AWX13071.1 hypothetical protein CEP49_00140 [Mergibacter septicus]
MFQFHHPSAILWFLLELSHLSRYLILLLIALLPLAYPLFQFSRLHLQQQQLEQTLHHLEQKNQIQNRLYQALKQKTEQQNRHQITRNVTELETRLEQLTLSYPNLKLSREWQFSGLTQAEINIISTYVELYHALTELFQTLPQGWQIEKISLQKNKNKQKLTAQLHLFHSAFN